MNYCELRNRKLISLQGVDASEFLQGILTCNIDTIMQLGFGFGGLLTPQGKILFDFFVVYHDKAFLLDVEDAMAEDLVRRLTFYKLRAAVEIEIEETLKVFALWGNKDAKAPQHNTDILIADPRLAQMGWRLFSPNDPPSATPSTSDNYEAMRINLGVPQGGSDYAYGETFPHEALFDQTGGLDFSKGCYVGQEVISRVHHRGTARKRIIMLTGSDNLPQFGTKITAAGKTLGEMGSSCGKAGLANLRLDRVNDAQINDTEILAGDVPVRAQIQSWVNFDWPES